MPEIKDRLIELRKERNLTQNQVATVLGMSRNGYASIEQGLAELSIKYVKPLCELYGVSADVVIGLKEF